MSLQQEYILHNIGSTRIQETPPTWLLIKSQLYFRGGIIAFIGMIAPVTKFTNKLADPETQKFFGQDAQQHMSLPPALCSYQLAVTLCVQQARSWSCWEKVLLHHPCCACTHTHTHTHTVSHTHPISPRGYSAPVFLTRTRPLLESGSRPFSGRSMALQYTDWVTQDSNISAFIRMEVSEHNRR
jgi:hypothetical protein